MQETESNQLKVLAQPVMRPPRVQAHIFFSAHGVPVTYVEDAGDPYKAEMEECIALITQELSDRGVNNDYTLAYQVSACMTTMSASGL
jgi:protoheme ferro-lyase